jgi:hypothetical protein
VSLVSPRAKIFEMTKTDANGNFKFNSIFLLDSIKLTAQARSGKNSDKVKLILDSIPNLPLSKNPNLGDVSTDIAQFIKTYIDNGKKLDDIYEQAGQLDKVHRLREVRIMALRSKAPAFKPTGIQIPEGHADHTYKLPDGDRCGTLGICLQGMIPGIVFKQYIVRVTRDSIPIIFNEYPYCRQGNNVSPMLRVVVDGLLITDREQIGEIFNNNTIDPKDVVKVEVVTTNKAMVGMVGGAAVIIYTNRGMLRKFYTPSLANISSKGFNKVREFYRPRYDKPGVGKLPDLRTTIYWNPYLKTDVKGKTICRFFNADGPGNYKVVVEGINAEGQLGRQIFKYGLTDSEKMNAGNKSFLLH